MERYELTKLLENINKKIAALTTSLNIDKLEEEYEVFLNEQSSPNFWDNVNEARNKIKEIANILNEKIEGIKLFLIAINQLVNY